MTLPFQYDVFDPVSFGGTVPVRRSFEESRVIVLPIPFERTTSYVAGTRNAPRAILEATTQVELWDEELQTDVHEVGIYALPQMELPFEDVPSSQAEIRRVADHLFAAGKYVLSLGGEHGITPPIVLAATQHYPSLSVLQIDAHADLRESYLGSRFSHACVMRRLVDQFDPGRLSQVGIRQLSQEESETIVRLGTHTFFDFNMRDQPNWIDRVVDSLGNPVYITFDCDGLDPATMPAVGTPVPGGLSWHEALRLLRTVFERRTVVGCDIVELCPIPGLVAPDFLCARLAFKMINYRFGIDGRTT
jgi:agmatinase